MSKLLVTVDIPPSVNSLYATVNGHRTLSKAGRSYKKDTGWIVKQAASEQGWEGGALYALTLHLWFKDKRRQDVSNRVKVCEDTIAEALGFDDRLIVDVRARLAGIDRERPRCEIELEVVE